MSTSNRLDAYRDQMDPVFAQKTQEIVETTEENGSIGIARQVSPYVESKIVPLDVGSSAARFLIHSKMLRKSAPLFALASKEQPVSLPELDEGPAHTLVHHLYAGTFERKLRYAPVGKFRHSTCVYCAAVQYEIPRLAELSKEEIVQAGEGLSIFDILRVARDHAFSVLPEHDLWYPQYLEDAIQKAMAKDPEPFRRPDFITRVEGNSRLLQIVWKTVMSNVAITPASQPDLNRLEIGAETPLAESMLTESEAPTQDSQHQLPSPTESVVNSPPTLREADDLQEPKVSDLDLTTPAHLAAKAYADPKDLGRRTSSDATSNDDFGLPDIEPIVSLPEAPRTAAISSGDTKKPDHVRADSVVEADSTAPSNSFDDAKRELVKETSSPVANGNHDSARKGKKKGKKKSSIVF